jgi:RNA polymerase-binding transcription factor DksA
MPAKKTTSVQKKSAKKTPAKKTPEKTAPDKKIARKAAAKKKSAGEAAAKKHPAKKAAPSKKPAKTTTSTKRLATKVAAKKKLGGKTTTKAASGKKSASKATNTKKPAKKVAAKKPHKKVAAPTTPAAKSPKKSAAKTTKASLKKSGASGKSPIPSKKTKPSASAKAVVSRSTHTESSKSASIVFSLDDVEQLIAAKKQAAAPNKPAKKAARKTAPEKVAAEKPAVEEATSEKKKWGAASLADILGFNPSEKNKRTDLNDDEIPKKWKKYYKLLTKLRAHVSDEINLHSSETLKHSSREDSGDLSGYGTHQADAGTDNFDRDFALSLVSSEQEALNEIEEAILRIKNGTYGICEVTGKPIPAARLTAVPFTHYSVEGQAEYEKNLRRKSNHLDPGGLFGDTSDVPKITSSDDDDD